MRHNDFEAESVNKPDENLVASNAPPADAPSGVHTESEDEADLDATILYMATIQ
jgi:hypothetical protein